MTPTLTSDPFIFNGMPAYAKWFVGWLDTQPIITALLILMGLDIAVGICRAIITKTLSSTISWRGMSRKVIMLLMLGVAAVLEPLAGGIPLSKLVGIFYTVTEALSILENAAASGVPLPRALVETLAKLREEGHQKQLRTGVAGIILPPGTHVKSSLTVPKADDTTK